MLVALRLTFVEARSTLVKPQELEDPAAVQNRFSIILISN